MSERIPDLQVRRQAVRSLDHCFVWASAGTGKTHTLTLKTVYLLLILSPEELYSAPTRSERMSVATQLLRSIALTTFTRKAAAEMQSRVYRHLDGVASAPSLDVVAESDAAQKDPFFFEIVLEGVERAGNFSRLREGAAILADLAAHLQISTLHSFAARILNRHPLQGDLPARLRYAREDEDDLAEVEERLIERWWQTQVFHRQELQTLANQILKVSSVRELREWLIWVFKQPWILEEVETWLETDHDTETLVEAIRKVGESLSTKRSSKMPVVGKALLESATRIHEGQGGAWLDVFRLAREERGYLFLDRAETNGVKQTLRALAPDQRRFFEQSSALGAAAARELIRTAYRDNWRAFSQFLRRFSDWSRSAVTGELGLVTFDDMIVRTRDLLRQDKAVRESEAARLRFLLVDEFQDTDRLQLELLEELFKPHSGSGHQVTGFFVGDLKQSIYRFRGADVNAIRDFQRRFSSLADRNAGGASGRPVQEFQLTTSFRTTATLAQFPNDFFSTVLPLAEPNEHLQPFRPDRGPKTEWIQLELEAGEKLTAAKARAAACRETARIIRDKMAEGSCRYADFLVLSCTNGELDQLLPHLQEAGVPVIATGAKTFYRHHEVLDALSLLIALYHPLDSLALATVLRSPLVQISDPEIHRLLDEIRPRHLLHGNQDLPDWLAPEPLDRLQILRQLASSRLTLPLSRWLHEVYAFIPKAAYLRRDDPEGRPLARLLKIFERFAEVVQDRVYPPVWWLLKQRERAGRSDRWDSDLGEDVNLADESIDAVRAMTVHKAKGLEAPVVIVVGWSTILERDRDRTRRPRVLSESSPDGSLRRGFNLPWGPVSITSNGFSAARMQETKNSREEACRLAYVAGTRARDELLLIHSVGDRYKIREELERPLEVWSSGEVPVSLHYTVRRPPEPFPSAVPEEELSLDWNRYVQLWQDRRKQLEERVFAGLKSPTGFDSDLSGAFQESEKPESGLQTGRLVHRYLEKYLQEEAFERTRLEAVAAELDTRPSTTALERSTRILSGFYDSSLVDEWGHSYRGRLENCKILAREFPVLFSLQGQPWHGVIDLLIEERGRILAIDYKSTLRPQTLPAHYRQQSDIYRAALERLYPEEDIGFEFWWLGVRPEESAPAQTKLPFR